MTDQAATSPAMASEVTASWTTLDVLDVAGPDAASYLHGQLSQNIEGMAEGECRWSLLLQPQGKVDAWMRVLRVGPEHFLLAVDAGFGETALARLERFKLRIDATITLSTESCLAIRGPVPTDQLEALVGQDGVAGFPTLWPTLPGFDLIGVATDAAGVSDLDFGDNAQLEGLRVAAGRPAMGPELNESTIPAAAGIVDMSVDFTKGCYVGQELVARIDSRGNNTPTSLVRVSVAGPTPLTAGQELSHDGATVGTITSAASATTGVEDGVSALAYVKRGVEVPGQVDVVSDDGAVRLAELRPLLAD